MPEAVSTGDGFCALQASLSETLKRLTPQAVSDLLLAGFGEQDLVRLVATTPPFSDVVAGELEHHLRQR